MTTTAFDITTFESTLPALIDRIEVGERIVGATSSQGADLSFSGNEGEGLIYDPSNVTVENDLVTLTVEGLSGEQSTITLNVDIL